MVSLMKRFCALGSLRVWFLRNEAKGQQTVVSSGRAVAEERGGEALWARRASGSCAKVSRGRGSQANKQADNQRRERQVLEEVHGTCTGCTQQGSTSGGQPGGTLPSHRPACSLEHHIVVPSPLERKAGVCKAVVRMTANGRFTW